LFFSIVAPLGQAQALLVNIIYHFKNHARENSLDILAYLTLFLAAKKKLKANGEF
jgi:hypothetical protein